MPANPKDLYNHLRKVGELSDAISYSQFREQWDTPGWNVDFHAHLRQKQLVSLNYEDFVYTFGEDDPNWDAEKGIEISDEEIQAAQDAEGKGPADDQDPENLAQNFTGLPFKDGELVSSDGKVLLTKTDEEVAQDLEIELQKQTERNVEKTEMLNSLYGNNLDARIAETAGIKVDKGFEDYVKNLEKGIPTQEKDRGADLLNKLSGSTANIPIQLEAAWEGTKALLIAGINESDGGGGLADVLSGNASFFDTYELLDPVNNELVSFESNSKRFLTLQKLNRGAEKPVQVYRNGKPVTEGKLADEYVGNKLKEIQKLNEGTFKTGSITEGFKQGDALEVAAGSFNAVSSLAATMIPAMLSGGTTLAPQVITPMWVDYNTTKAMEKYGDEEDPIAAMIAADDTEFAVPLALGAGALGLEAVGFKGISKYMVGSKMGGSIMGIAKNQLGWMLTANKEGGTEWLQGGMEDMSQELAKGKSMGSAVKLAAKNLFSQDALERYLQGAFGSGISTAPSAVKRSVQRALRSDPAGHKAIVEGINDISRLKEARAKAVKAKNKVEVKLIDADIKSVENNIKRVVQENNTIFNHLTDKENKQLRAIAKEMDGLAADAAEVDAAVTRGDITKMEGYQTKRKLKARHSKLSNDIADLKANVDLSQIRSDVALAIKLGKNSPNLKVVPVESDAQAEAEMQGATDENGKPYTKAQLKQFAKESPGLFWEMDGVEYIVLNQNKAKSLKLTTTGQHEFLHKVLNRVLKADPKLALKMGGAVKETIKKLGEAGLIKGKRNPETGKLILEERLAAYRNESKSIQAEELMTILSESIKNGDIKITEESTGFFGDVKELVRRSMLDFGVKRINLDGDGVMQFIKDYSREYQRGKFSRATKKLMNEGKMQEIPSPTKMKQSLDAAVKLKWEKQNEEFMGDYLTSSSFTVKGEKFNMLITRDNEAGATSMGPGIRGIKKGGEVTFNNITDGIPRRSLLKRLPNSIKVFGIVVNATKDAIKKEGYDAITFTADRDGRTSTYTAIASKVARDMGWKVDVDKSYTDNMYKYTVYNPKRSGVKQSKVSKPDLYERTNKLYNEYKDDKHTAGFLIGMEWQNQIEKLARKYKNLPGYATNIEDVVAYVMTANQGIPGLVNSYIPGKKTKDGENEVSLEGYINKYLPNYINTALGKHGIGEAKGEGKSTVNTDDGKGVKTFVDSNGNQIALGGAGERKVSGFAVNIDDVKDATSSDTAEDSLNLGERKTNETQEDTRRPQLKDVVGIENNPELKQGIENKVVKNISASIKFFGKAKTRNEKIDAFIKETRKGIKNDEKAAGEFMNFIMRQGVENFLADNKVAFFDNTQRNDLQRNPLFKKAVQQRFKGVWKSRQAVTTNGKTTYEYLKDDGTVYPARHPDMDRDKMTETGTTAGHYKFRKVKNFDQVISTNEFVDFFYKDGKNRQKLNKVKLQALASQFSSEIGLELFAEQLQAGQGPIFDVLSSRVELTSEMTPDQVKAANEQKLIIREGMASILTEKGIQETLKDLERGGIRQSKVNKTGFTWFDAPRIEMTNYLAGLENNDIRSGVVDRSIKSPEYLELYEEMKDAYDMYLSMQLNQDDWANSLQSYSNAFKDKDFVDFDAFVDDTLGQVNNSVNGILGTNPKDTSLGKRNEVNKAIARKEGVDGYINDILTALPITERGAALADIVNTLVGATSSNLYENTPGFYRDVVQPAITKHKIKPSDFSLVEIEGGNTIHYKGKKITTDYAKGMYAEDTFGMFDVLVEEVPVISNSVNTAARIAEAKVAKKQYVDYLKWLNKNHKRMSPNTVAMMFKAFSNGSRSVAQTMIPLTKTMLVKQANEMASYTTVPSVPSKFINLASLKFVLTGKGLGSLNRIIDGASRAVLPKAYAKVVDQFHHNTPNNNFNSDKVNKKLRELDLPKIDLTNLIIEQNINVVDVEGRAAVVKFNKTVEAIGQGMKFSKPAKGISVWDFDDTLAKTKSNILYTMPDGTKGKLNAEEFAKKGDQMLEEGVKFDFSEFSKVVNGAKGPLFDTAVKRNEKFGNENVFILTARPQNSARAIHEFLKGIGLDIKIENITGLQDSSSQAKADWIAGKAAEGYNDFYFADDHISNVAAVKDVLNSIDVKSDVQQAGIKQSKVLSKEFNEMMSRDLKIEGLNKQKMRSSDAELKGKEYDAKYGTRFNVFVPPSAEDFMGLLYKFAGKGKQGDADLQFFMDNLVNPYIEGIERLDQMNTAINLEYTKLQAAHPEVVKKLHAKVEGTDYTYDMAIRYYLYQRAGYGDKMVDANGEAAVATRVSLKLMAAVMGDKKVLAYANAVSTASRQDSGYVEPDMEHWLTQSIATDFKRLITDAHRKKVLEKFINNSEEIFSEANLNKIEAYYGINFRKALYNKSSSKPGAVQRMISGRNAKTKVDPYTNWINGAIAPIMFLNARSAFLQLLSVGNFVNWTDNNPLMVAKAMADTKQFYADMMFIWNSPKMLQRRDGLRFSIEEAELANVGGTKGPWEIFKKRMIKLGFKPTQLADALAIGIGGAPLYRNRINTYKKQGMSTAEAEALAWRDFGRISDEAQQSSDQMLTSAEQSGGLGRLILAFANTPSQYTRRMKKAALDLKNGRGDWKTNVSRIIYYGFVQNVIFSTLQTALMASYSFLGGDDEDERNEKERKKIYNEAFAKAREPKKGSTKPKNAIIIAKQIADAEVAKYDRAIAMRLKEKEDRVKNGMLDSVLRGLGVRGAIIASAKNALLETLSQLKTKAELYKAEDEVRIKISGLYEKVLDGTISMDEAAEGEKMLNKALLEIDSGSYLFEFGEVLLAALSISPPLSSKLRDAKKIINNIRFNGPVMEKKGWSYDSPKWEQVGLGVKFVTNLPTDWIPKKMKVIKHITQDQATPMQKAWMGMGWSPYDMGLKDEEFEQIKEDAKNKKKEISADRSKSKRDLKKLKKDVESSLLSPTQRRKVQAELKRDRKAAGEKAARTRAANKKQKQISTWEEAQRKAKLRRERNK